MYYSPYFLPHKVMRWSVVLKAKGKYSHKDLKRKHTNYDLAVVKLLHRTMNSHHRRKC